MGTETEVNVKTSEKTSPKSMVTSHKRPRESFPWQRLALSLLGVGVISGMWRWATYHLYSLPDHSISAFTSITNNASYVIGALVVFFVTGRLIYEWKNQTVTTVTEQASHAFERKEEKKDITERIEHVFTEGEKGSPLVRPFSQAASQE